MTVSAKTKEADIMRALRSAKKVGAKRVIIGADGSIDIWFEGGPAANEAEAAFDKWEAKYGHHDPDGPIKISNPTKERVKF